MSVIVLVYLTGAVPAMQVQTAYVFQVVTRSCHEKICDRLNHQKAIQGPSHRGAGGFGREAAWLVEEINRSHPTWELLGFSASMARLLDR